MVELNPRSLDDRLALAQSALMFRDYALATNALAGVDAAGRKTAIYCNIAGEVASTVGQLAQAEADFSEAARLEPTNPVPQLNLAVVRLHGTNAATLAEARAALTANFRLQPGFALSGPARTGGGLHAFPADEFGDAVVRRIGATDQLGFQRPALAA